jgi:UDP-3-O-[3-hydroxymyristoyl] glucosamine N-acyltransferase
VRATIQQLAALVGGTVHGDAGLVVDGAAPLGEAGPRHITFLEGDRHLRLLKQTRAAAVVLPAALRPRLGEIAAALGRPVTLLEAADPLAAFVAIVRHFRPGSAPPLPGVDLRAAVHPTAVLGPGTNVGPFAAVGEDSVLGARCRLHPGAIVGRRCRLGDDVELYPHAVLYDGTVLGDRVTVHAGAVLGADGFGYRPQNGRHVKIPQLGWVEVADDVEIGAATTIDRGTFGPTRVGVGTKIDNLVQVGHNCRIGRHNLIVGQVGIAGSCTTGDYVVMAGQVGVGDHVHIGDGAQIGARSGLHRDVPAGERILGTPGRPEREEKRILFSLEKLPELCRDVRHIKQHLGLDAARPGEAGPKADGEGPGRDVA